MKDAAAHSKHADSERMCIQDFMKHDQKARTGLLIAHPWKAVCIKEEADPGGVSPFRDAA